MGLGLDNTYLDGVESVNHNVVEIGKVLVGMELQWFPHHVVVELGKLFGLVPWHVLCPRPEPVVVSQIGVVCPELAWPPSPSRIPWTRTTFPVSGADEAVVSR